MNNLIIGIAGGSGSGKTTLAIRLKERFGEDEVRLISHDSYYKRHDELPYPQPHPEGQHAVTFSDTTQPPRCVENTTRRGGCCYGLCLYFRGVCTSARMRVR